VVRLLLILLCWFCDCCFCLFLFVLILFYFILFYFILFYFILGAFRKDALCFVKNVIKYFTKHLQNDGT
jgi:hypothetical protein